MEGIVDSVEYTWAVIFVVGCLDEPFVKIPVVRDTVLAAQAVVGLTHEDRFVNCNGTIANNVRGQYKLYMLCGPEYFAHVDNIVDIVNWFYKYLRTEVDAAMDRETAYALCTSIFPAMTVKDRALHVLLTPFEIRLLTKSKEPVSAIKPIRFEPHPIMDKDVVR